MAFSHLPADGRAVYMLSVENTSGYPAQLPFFCVMDLGLNIEPHANWQVDKISSDGRRLVRLSYRGSSTLLPSDRIMACNLVMHLSRSNGLAISFGAGTPVPLENLRDLRLFTITGAANFPSARSSLHIPADYIRRQVLRGLDEPERMAG